MSAQLDSAKLEFESALDGLPAGAVTWQLGNYDVLGEIGRGGMGVIYRARQRMSERIVAVKRLLSYHADSPETIERFRLEARAVASLDHPNILPIYEVADAEDGLPFFSMKLASAGSLLGARHTVDGNPREAVSLLEKVARAVHYAHTRGILHRDLKPGNILLDRDGEPLVCDFGLAKWLDKSTDLTRSVTVFGTPGYIAPEQAGGPAAKLTAAADIYSLGAILFELLAQRPPFVGEHAWAVLNQAREKPAPRLRSIAPSLDRDLDTICARCLEREPHLRYWSALELAADLGRWLERRPIRARPVSIPARAWRSARRNPILAASLAVALLLAAITGETMWQRVRIGQTILREQLARRSVTMLPLLDLNTVSAAADWRAGLPTLLQDEISKIAAARVQGISGSTGVFVGLGTPEDLRVISKDTGARTILTGTRRALGDGVRISLSLHDAARNQTLFNRIVELPHSTRAPADLASVVANQLSHALDLEEVNNSESDPVFRNQAAADYLRAGHELENRRTMVDLDRAAECYRKAIAAEPKSSLARASLVIAIITRTHLGPVDPELWREAETRAAEAVQLDPRAGPAHRAIGSIFFQKGQFDMAREEALTAIELDGLHEGPSFLGTVDKMLGRPDRALRWYTITKHWQTHPADDEFDLADCWADLAGDPQAEAIYRRVAALHPELPEGWLGICRLRLLEGDFAAARAILQANRGSYGDFLFPADMEAQLEFFSRNYSGAERLYARLANKDPNGGGSFFAATDYQSALGCLVTLNGDSDRGREILRRCLTRETDLLRTAPRHPEVLYRLAAVEASLGDKEAAIPHLGEAAAAGWIDYRSMKLDPRFDPIRSDNRYQKIASQMEARVTSLRNSITE